MKLREYDRNEIFTGKLSRFYDLIFFATTFGLGDITRKNILKFISEHDKKILDLATGTGSSAIVIKNKFKNAKVYGADLSKEMLEIARKKNKKIKFSLQNIEKTNFKSNSFDIVTISFGLHEIPLENRYNVIKEAYKLLKKKGKFIMLDFHAPKNIFLRLLFLLFVKIAEPYGKSFLRQDLVSNLKKYKFYNIKKIDYYNSLFQIIYGVK